MADEKKDVKVATTTSVVEKKEDGIPRSRLNEELEKNKGLTEQVNALTGQVNALLDVVKAKEKSKEEDDDPNIDPNIKQMKGKIKDIEGALGTTLDQLDKSNTLLDPIVNKKEYSKMEKDIEARRVQLFRQGQAVSRKQVYLILKSEKAAEKVEETETEDTDTKPLPTPETKTTAAPETKPTSEKTPAELEKDLKDKVF